MKLAHLPLLALLAAGLAQGQDVCHSPVWDETGKLNSTRGSVETATTKLSEQGADAHAILLTNVHGNLDRAERQLEAQCSNWQSGTGVRKSSLIVLMVSMDHQVGIYYGSAWHKALDDHWNRLKQEYMVPRLRAGDFAGAFATTETQIGKRLVAASDEAIHPNQSTTINQAADYSGLWSAFKWLLALGFLSCLGYLLYSWYRRRQDDQHATSTAQLTASSLKSRTADLLNQVRNDLDTYQAVHPEKNSVWMSAGASLNRCSEDFARMGNMASLDPDQPGLSPAQYDTIASSYRDLYNDLQRIRAKLGDEPAPAPPSRPSSTSATASGNGPASVPPAIHHHSHTAPPPEAPIMPGGNVFAPTTIIMSTSEARRDREDREEERSTSASSSHSHRSSSSDDDGSGGSSSWSSSDSDSDSGSGGSSSFDSSSSDSGGGGSSGW